MVAAVEAGKYADDLALLHPLRGQAVVTADEVALRQDAYHPMQDIFLPHAIQRDIVAAQAALGRGMTVSRPERSMGYMLVPHVVAA